MKHFPVSKRNNTLCVHEIPDAVKLIKINNFKSKRLADFGLHKSDLGFAESCLDELNKVNPKNIVVRQSLWRCAIVSFIKCFGSSRARGQLNEKKIWKGNDLALTNFYYFRNLRNKYFIHDENAYSQSLPGAAINNGNKPYKIEKIICTICLAETIGQDNYNNLHLLIKTAKEYVIKEFDVLCNNLTKELEKISYKALINKDSIMLQIPDVDKVDKNRIISND